MVTWVAWAAFAGVAATLGFAGCHFSVRTVRYVAGCAALALAAGTTSYGLTRPAARPADLAGAFARGADGIAAAFFQPLWPGHGLPAPGRNGWIIIAALVVLGYRELEAWTLHWQAPVLDTSRLADGQPSITPAGKAADGLPGGLTDGQRHAQLAAEVRFRLAAVQVRSPSILPGGSRTSMLASIAESSGVAGAGLAGAVIRFTGALWPAPRRHRLQVWVEAGAATKVTAELTGAASGATVATRTMAAGSLSEAATMVAGYVARHVFAQDPATPDWCYGAVDGRDLALLQLARAERADVTDAGDMERSRLAQIAILRRVTGAVRCAGIVRYELAQLYDLGGDQVLALRLHAMNREQYPRFFRSRYRLAMSLEMVANSGFSFADAGTAREAIGQTLGSLYRCGLADVATCPPDGLIARGGDDRAPWVVSPALNTVLLEAARKELLAIRRALTLPAVAWATFRRRDERATWKPHRRTRVRQGFRDGADAGLLLVAVRKRLNGDPVSGREYRRALRVADAITGDSDPIAALLWRPSSEWTLTGGPPRLRRDRVRRLPWQCRTVSWQAAYAVACLYSALAQHGLAGEDRVVASLRRAIGNRSSEMERPYDWIAHDPDFAPLLARDSRRYPEFTRFLAEQKRLDYPSAR